MIENHAPWGDDRTWMIPTWMENRGGLGNKPWAEDMRNPEAFGRMKTTLNNRHGITWSELRKITIHIQYGSDKDLADGSRVSGEHDLLREIDRTDAVEGTREKHSKEVSNDAVTARVSNRAGAMNTSPAGAVLVRVRSQLNSRESGYRNAKRNIRKRKIARIKRERDQHGDKGNGILSDSKNGNDYSGKSTRSAQRGEDRNRTYNKAKLRLQNIGARQKAAKKASNTDGLSQPISNKLGAEGASNAHPVVVVVRGCVESDRRECSYQNAKRNIRKRNIAAINRESDHNGNNGRNMPTMNKKTKVVWERQCEVTPVRKKSIRPRERMNLTIILLKADKGG